MRTILVSDQVLVEQYLQGEEKSLQILVNRHKQRVFTHIYHIIRDREITGDLFQETFIKVIRTLRSGGYREEGKFLPWVLRVAHNLVIDHIRRSGQVHFIRESQNEDKFNIFDVISAPEESDEDKLVREEIHSDVRMLIKELPDTQKEVLVMRMYNKMSFKEIAEKTNVSINTSLGRMRYALINLRKLIARKGLVVTES